jgi:hypothetical protein
MVLRSKVFETRVRKGHSLLHLDVIAGNGARDYYSFIPQRMQTNICQLQPMPMKTMTHASSVIRIAAASLFVLCLSTASNVFGLDNGVDASNLGKGDWIYFMSAATNHLGGNVSSVHDIPTLMSYEKSQGMTHIIVKAGDAGTQFPSSGPQFTTSLVNAAHAAGLKIFAYTRSWGTNVTSEISLATTMLNRGADGFVIDAEVEWESSHLANNAAKATQLCQGIKNAFPTRFLAHAPFMYISLHSSFPYKQFGLLCDAVMPQDYFTSFGISPSQCVTDMDSEWRNWQNSLVGTDRNAIKPIVPVCQGWNVSSSETTTGAEITTFINGIKNDANPASIGGYKGVNFWRADLHTADMWNAIGAATIGGGGGGVSDIVIDNPSASVVGTWSTGTTAVDRFGSDYRFKNQGTGSAYLKYTPNILTAGHYNVYEWHSVGSNRTTGAPEVVTFNGGTQTVTVNQQLAGGQWNLLGNFRFAAGTAGSVKITDASAGSTLVVIADAIKFVYSGP